jgi:hypothetical protein
MSSLFTLHLSTHLSSSIISGWVPPKSSPLRYRICFFGFYLFNTCLMILSVFSLSLFYLFTLSFLPILYVLLLEFLVVCAVKWFDGELTSFSNLARPTLLGDYVLGPLMKLMYVLASYTTVMSNSRFPPELGAHVASGLLLWRYVSSLAIVAVCLPEAVKRGGDKPWLDERRGWTIAGGAAAGSLLGLAITLSAMNTAFDKSRLFRRQVGKDFFRDMWLADFCYSATATSKDEERARWLRGLHPQYHRRELVEEWLCVELTRRYGNDSADTAAPVWLTTSFNGRMREIFVYFRVDETTRKRVEDALKALPVFVEDEKKGGGSTNKEGGNKNNGSNKVAPE